MSELWIQHFRLVVMVAAVLFSTGLYCLLVTHNLIRVLVGIELLTKAVTLLLVLAGAVTGRLAAVQALVVTVIVIEVVIIAVAAGIVVAFHAETGNHRTSQLIDPEG